MIEGLSHITFIVRDLDRMSHFLVKIFDAREIYASGTRTFSIAKEKFFQVKDVWIAIMEGEPPAEKTYHHIAFKVSDRDFEIYANRVRSLGVEILEGRRRQKQEGQSIYFYDYDHHLYELHTGTLKERLEFYQNQPAS